ncbi:Uma2 family endonuclease [Streptomyces beigongshangae]|uniref:Uma2 family endonuclease n=1 Tax=Streptomyces beigongshangae TaxID=2841597 RepID=UPI001C84D9C7|nr:Uma2 family endonuclease [Streptomyces sp. REN17]
MSALTVYHEPERSWDDLVRFREETQWPEGGKVEIIEGVVTVSPTPANQHNLIADAVQRRLCSAIPEDRGIFQTLSIAVPSRLGMSIPDLVVVPTAEVDGPGTYIPAAAAELVVEVTSKSDAQHDRIGKPAAYAAAGIPLYLLIDRWAPGGPTVTLYGEPRGDVYRVLHAGKLGEQIVLPDPFGLKLDTSVFPVH